MLWVKFKLYVATNKIVDWAASKRPSRVNPANGHAQTAQHIETPFGIYENQNPEKFNYLLFDTLKPLCPCSEEVQTGL